MHRLHLQPSSQTSKTANRAYKTFVAIKLAELDARPTVIAALAMVSPEQAKAIYSDIQNKPATRGRKCSSLDNFVRNRNQHLQISVLITNFLRAIEYGIEKPKAMILAFEDLKHRFPSNDDKRATITFDRAYNLIQAVTVDQTHGLNKCTTCSSQYFVDKLELPAETICPSCNSRHSLMPRISKSSPYLPLKKASGF